MEIDPVSIRLCPYCHKGGGNHSEGCPNYDPPVLCVCEICNQDVISGEPYIIYDSHTFHSDCFLDRYEKTE